MSSVTIYEKRKSFFPSIWKKKQTKKFLPVLIFLRVYVIHFSLSVFLFCRTGWKMNMSYDYRKNEKKCQHIFYMQYIFIKKLLIRYKMQYPNNEIKVMLIKMRWNSKENISNWLIKIKSWPKRKIFVREGGKAQKRKLCLHS